MNKINRILLFIVVFAIVVSVFIATSSAAISSENDVKSSSAIIYVPDNYTKIQWAIDNATDGDLIIINAFGGPYYENVVVDKRINLTGIEMPVIDAGENGTIIEVIADYVNISNFTIKNSSFYKYGIHSFSSHNTFMNNNILNTCVGIYLDSSNNNTLMNNNVSSNSYGISLVYSSNNQISNCTILNTMCGINIDDSQNNQIINCTISNGGSISISGSQNIEISNCILSHSGGISLYGSSNSSISSCRLLNNTDGITFGESPSNRINSCTISNNIRGIYICGFSKNNMLRNNVLSNNTYNFGICYDFVYGYLSDLYQDIDTTNMINGKPIYYLVEQSGQVFDGKSIGYLGLVSCDNITVKNINSTHNVQGLLIVNTTNSTISNCIISNNRDGIGLRESSNNRISSCKISNNLWDGILFYKSSNNNKISGCTLSDNSGHGIGLHESSNNNISDCTLSGSMNGIDMSRFSINNQISYCEISNSRWGIDLGSNNRVINSIISNNSKDGIYLFGSSNCQISGCTISNNSQNGIYISTYSNNNLISHNNLVNNNPNAYDCNPENNDWSHPFFLEGNHWSDYTGLDDGSGTGKHALAGDGIGDTDIPQPAEDYDFYPFVDKSGWPVNKLYVIRTQTEKSIYYLKENATVSCTVQDETGYNITADSVNAGILKPDSTIEWVTMTEGLIGHYNATFINTSLNGTYYVTIYANKTGYVNNTAELSFEISTPVHNLNTCLNYTTIQAAIDAAETKDGHTIQVDARIYYENVVINKQLNLTGIGIPTVDGGGNGSAITVTADGCQIDSFKATGSGSYPNAGIKIQSNNNIIRNNTALINNQGIILWCSENNTVVGNTASYNEDGICLCVYSHNNTLSNNIVNKNEGGICVRESSFNTLDSNTVENNDVGIYLYDSYHNIIKGNTINSNNNHGIGLDYSNNNLVYHNNLINNTKQAYSDGYNNRWDNGYPTGGNYWSDHTCSGNPSCGNQPYYIWENSLDHYPFQDPDSWLIPYEEHDLVVTNITAPEYIYLNSTTLIYSTIYNVGLNNESNIAVNFIVDGVNQSNTTISYINSNASIDVNFEWTAPDYVGNHTLTIYIEPMVNEPIIWNNYLSKNISVIKKEIIYVDDDFEDDPESHSWNTIQKGIVDAKNGDIVFVYNGTYYENVVVDKTINLTGEDEDTTIIDSGGSGDVIKVAADQVNINGFSIRNSEERNAGVDISLYNNITVAYCNISNNRIGIKLYGCSDITILDCEIMNNDHAGILGCGCASKNIQISNSSISNNGVGGIHIQGSSISITNCTIADNEGEEWSGDCAGVYLENSYDSQITNCTISNNPWAGIYISGYSSFNNQILYCNILSNSGPGIRFWSGETNSTIADCCIYSNNDHGIELRSFTTITNCVISNNYGCGIYTEVGVNQISGCNIHSNLMDGIHFITTGVSHNQVTNCKCSDNKNGIYIDKYWGSQDYEIMNCKILNNDCGINILRSGSKIINCDIANNNESVIVEESDNIIYRNNIINNKQAVDKGNNLWDNGSVEGGNYWSDHKCTGNPSNGFQPYHIDNDSIDNFPFEDANGWLPEKQPPVASFIFSPQYPENPVVNQTVTFNASSSYDLNGTIVNYKWDFGDGTNSTGEIVNHSYSDTGNYLVILTVTDDEVMIDTDITAITIWSTPKKIYVDDDFEDDPIKHKWDTVQEGIDDANSGDTVFVYNGTYNENVIINKNAIDLIGEDEKNTIIDGSGGAGIRIAADWINISQLGINNSAYSGIEIFSSTKIGPSNNCITNCIISNNGNGISFYYAKNNCVENCIIYDSDGNGIHLDYVSKNNIITNCNISDNGLGIYFDGSDYNKIIRCNISENNDDGIRFVGSSNNQIINCNIYSNNLIGIRLTEGYHGASINNEIIDCNVWNNENGIYLYGSYDNVLRRNSIRNNTYNFGICSTWWCKQDIDTSNTINGKLLYYLIEDADLTIDGAILDVGYIALISCNNISISNLNISQNYRGLLLINTTNSMIKNCSISNNSDGIYFDSNSGCNEVTNCTILNNEQGICIDSNTINKIISCSISKNRVGIQAGNSYNQQIMNCIISKNDEDGIYLGENYYLINNAIISNGNRGVYGWSSNIITNCIIWDNGDDLSGPGAIATYSDIQDNDPGEGNIHANPMFIDPIAGDYHLRSGSPCIDAGNNTGIPSTDFNGNSRLIDGEGDGIAIVDMGVFEFIPVMSCDSQGIEKNTFIPNDNVYTRGGGLEPNTEYTIWIQNDPVNENDILNTSEDPSGLQETITTDEFGYFDPILIWSISPDEVLTYHEYDIVADKQSNPNTGKYNSSYDGIDSATIVGFAVSVPEFFEKELVLGWNLISLPLTPEDNNTTSVLENDTIEYDAVLQYNATSKQFEVITTGTMDTGIGYFVNITTAGIWKYEGTAFTSKEIPLKSGLNMIGWLNYSKNINDALSSIDGKYIYIARWNATSQRYEAYNPNAPAIFNKFGTMDRGEGYFISMIQEETLIINVI